MSAENNENFVVDLMRGGFAQGHQPFLTTLGRVWRYADIEALSARLAGALIARGMRPGDRLMVQVEKSPENVALYLAALRAGFVYTPLNTAYTDAEVSYFLDDGAPAIFVCTPDRAPTLSVNRPAKTECLTLGSAGAGSLLAASDAAAPETGIATRHSDDLAVILYTSGTTGRSKGAMLTHGNLSANAAALCAAWGFSGDDILVHALPIFHIHGLFVALNTAMLAGATVRFLPKFDAHAVQEALDGASVMMGVPTFYARLLADDQFTKEACSTIRLFVSGSAPLTAETHRAFLERTGHAILERYGMSEAGIITSNPLEGARVAGSVGYAVADYDLRIVGDDGVAAPPDEAGVLEVRGPSLFKGYWRKPEKTAEAFRDGGWFSTGDIGAVSEDGRLTLSGRQKDLIIAGGYNIYPKEIEQRLDAIPGLVESAVIGAPHPDLGEGAIAVIVVDDAAPPTQEAIAKALSSLARFKRPRRIVRVDALPRNAMGKVQKQVLRKTYEDSFRAT